MILKIFKAVWFLSLLITLTVFLYIYASLPETLVLDESGVYKLSREGFFYLTLALIAVFNVLVFVVSRLFVGSSVGFIAWFYGLIASLNLFFVILLYFFHLFNSDERFDFARLGFAIYGSVALILIWSVAWPVVLAVRKLQAVK